MQLFAPIFYCKNRWSQQPKAKAPKDQKTTILQNNKGDVKANSLQHPPTHSCTSSTNLNIWIFLVNHTPNPQHSTFVVEMLAFKKTTSNVLQHLAPAPFKLTFCQPQKKSSMKKGQGFVLFSLWLVFAPHFSHSHRCCCCYCCKLCNFIDI